MASIGDLFLKVVADLKGFHTDVQKGAEKAGDAGGASLGKRLSASLKKSWSGGEIGKGLVQGLGLAGGLGAVNLLSGALSTAVGFIGDSIKAASSLNETMAKSRVIFGGNSAEIEKWAGTAAKAFGQSKRQALDTASGFAGLFDTVGISIDKSTEMAQKLTVLGSDLASFFDTDVETALQALRSGLSGESEPLRKFNVFLSETAVAAKLAQMGIKKTGAAFTEAQKATARYALILEQTGSAQGDFARTSDSMANQGRSLTARMEDLSATLGEKFLPFVIAGQQAALDFTDALEGVGDAATHNEQPLTNLANILHDLFKSPDQDARTFLGGLFDGLNDLQSGLADAAASGNDFWTFWDDHSSRSAREMAKNADRSLDAIERLRGGAAKDLGAVGGALDETGVAALEMGKDIKQGANEGTDSFEDMRDKIVDAASDIVDEAYDVLDNAAALSAANAEIAAAKRVLASATASEAEKADAKDVLREVGRDQAKLVLDLTAAGAGGSKKVAAAIADMKERLKTATGQERKAILATLAALKLVEDQAKVTFRQLVKTNKVIPPSQRQAGSGGHLAAGGPTTANVPYLVGERGPELHVPSYSGQVIDAQTTAAILGGGNSTTNIALTMPVQEASDPFETATQLRRLADFKQLAVPR